MIRVVAAVLFKDNKFLIAKRNLRKTQGGLWEFPGGKIENGETEIQALKRELKEELDVSIDHIEFLGKHKHCYPEKEIELIYFKAQLIGNITLKEHEEYCWITKKEKDLYSFSEADIRVFDYL